ncbi:MAG: peptidylprolyl isomerase [Pedobacter sp.]|nr:MAG: peptidylprolyl isomerase [Pedobacter sp.]
MRKYFSLLFLILFVFNKPVGAQTSIKEPSYVKIETNLGTMYFKLATETPNHTSIFLRQAKKGVFNQYDFNRVIKGFVIQGGEKDSAYAEMNKMPGQKVNYVNPEFNANLFHQKGALAAGRDDNKDKKSFEEQFYVVDGKKYTDAQLDGVEKRIGGNFKFTDSARRIYKEIGGVPHLDQNYTVFGQLIKGYDVLEKIANAKKDKADTPLNRISIKVSVLNKREIKKLLSGI